MTSKSKELKTLLKKRNYNFKKLAAHAGVCRTQLSQVLSGARVADYVRRKVSILLEPPELAAVGWPAAETEYQI